MYTTESFCNFIWEASYSNVLQRIVKADYREFEIPKKNGTRKIQYLKRGSSLEELQKKLLVGFLEKQQVPVCVKGFKKGGSYKEYLSPHIGSKYFLRIDIEDFFPSITGIQIKNGLDFCISCNSEDDKDKLYNLLCDIVTLNGSLPQGACTSPAVSNLVMTAIDQRILKYCQALGICYTRYADDLLFSSPIFNFKEKNWFLKKIKHILSVQSLKVNYSKIKYGTDSLVLNGYVIASEEIRLSRSRLADIRHLCVFIRDNYSSTETKDVEKFLREVNKMNLKHRDLIKYPFNSKFQVIQYLCGYRAFLISFIDNYSSTTAFQKNLRRLIGQIEVQIIRLT